MNRKERFFEGNEPREGVIALNANPSIGVSKQSVNRILHSYGASRTETTSNTKSNPVHGVPGQA